MATYLVTGAAGFIGARICELLLSGGHNVVGIDNLNDYYDVRLKDYRLGKILRDESWRDTQNPRVSTYSKRGQLSSGRFIFMPYDIENIDCLEKLFSDFKFDAVFNLAARAGVRASIENPHIYLSTNAGGVLNLLECQRKYGVKKLLLASTSSLYAGCSTPFSEDLAVNTPLSPYAAAKKAAEMMAYSYHRLYGIDVTVLRYFTVIGPAGRPDMALFRFIKAIDEGRPITVYGTGEQTRDFTFVDDIARGTILASALNGYEIVNLGGGRRPIQLQRVIANVEEMLGRRATIIRAAFHKGDMADTSADITKARRILDWVPQVDAVDGIKRCVEWHLEHRPWIANIQI